MKIRLQRWADQLRTSFWFVPIVMTFAAALLALGLLQLDRAVDPGVKASLSWAYSGGPEGARSVLSTIAGSMITAASVTFSLASVALSIASQQYGSRVLRNFMQDRVTQVLLGTFVSTFIYCVLVVRDIRGSDTSVGFVPSIAVTVAILLTLISLILLILFVHHVSTSIQASHIVRVVADGLAESIPKLYPGETEQARQAPREEREYFAGPRQEVLSPCSGYLQAIDLDTLLKVASKHDLRLELTVKPGDHIVSGSVIALANVADALPEAVVKSITRQYLCGGERTPSQDVRYRFQQLCDVIIRALSPGINDPFTAINGIDQLATAFALLAEREPVSPYRKDEAGQLRLKAPSAHFSEILAGVIEHIAHYASGDAFVLQRLERVLDIAQDRVSQAQDVETVRSLRAKIAFLIEQR